MAEIHAEVEPLYADEEFVEPSTQEDRETTKHPDFDEMWAQYRNFVFWWAYKLHRIFCWCEAELFLGQLTLRFNRCLYTYDPAKAEFNTYFSYRLVVEMARKVVKFESEVSNVRHYDDSTKRAVKQETHVNYATFEQLNHLYRVPADRGQDWFEEVIGSFDNRDHFWDYMLRGQDARCKDIFYMRYQLNCTLQQVADHYGLSKERIRQIEDKALNQLKDKFLTADRFARLFN